MADWGRLFNRASRIADLQHLIQAGQKTRSYPLATRITKSIPHYSVDRHNPPSTSLQDEWHHALNEGPGIVVLSSLVQPPHVQRAERCTLRIAAQERGTTQGDHFAAPGSNVRIWNYLQKHAMADPQGFVAYYAQPWLSAIAAAWLGPGFTVTAQVNIVQPGGEAQVPHRDYHLGFQSASRLLQFPQTIHTASQYLTLQGAIAHGRIDEHNGATKLLPFSQRLGDGFLRIQEEPFRQFVEENYIQLVLDAGDAVFFNPALFHAAGKNHSEMQSRSANLLQISSAFGKPMETLDRVAMVGAVYDSLLEAELSSAEKQAVVDVVAEGYSFPTSLDRDVPKPDGSMPVSQHEVVLQALQRGARRSELLGLVDAGMWRKYA